MPKQIKNKVIKFLNNAIPERQGGLKSHVGDSYNYQHILELIKNLLGYNKEGLEFIFKKYNFAEQFFRQASICSSSYYDYIEEFINSDFKKNFWLVIKSLSDQFQSLYSMSYDYIYEGYEISWSYSGLESNYDFHISPLESCLSRCIGEFYKETKDWEFLKSFISLEFNKDNPVFVKRSFIPFLAQKLEESSEKNPEDNKFYKSLEVILKIKKGFPSTEDVLVKELSQIHSRIKDNYLEKLAKMILYKYSKEGISYDIFIIQFLFQLIESGKTNFKKYLKKILLNKTFKNHYINEQSLRLFESKMTNQNINEFFNEIKDELDISQNHGLIYRSVILDLQTSSLKKSNLFKLFKSSSKKDLNLLASIIEKDLWNKSGSNLLKQVLEIIKNHLDLEDFYKRMKVSERLKEVIIQLTERAINYDIDLSERIIKLCVEDTNLCGESEDLHNEVSKGRTNLGISTMRAHLCFAINNYIASHNQKTDSKSLKKLKMAFDWVKLLIDLDGALADKIDGFPKPNYNLRSFAIMPLISLGHHEIRNRLNKFEKGLGDKIKNFAFDIIEKTEQEVRENKSAPHELFNRISYLFNYIRDLNEKEAEKLLSFIEYFRIEKASYFFIYYALFREKYFKEKGVFKSKRFKEILRNICKSKPDQLKYNLSFTIYKDIKKKIQASKSKPDFDFFEKIKDHWTLLFENTNKDMLFPLLMTLSFVLKDKIYYNDYKKYFFQLIEKELKDNKNLNYHFIQLDKILPAISKNDPNDLIKVLFLLLDKGDPASGYIPFGYEARRHLIPEIKKAKNKIPKEKIFKAKEELRKYNETLDDETLG